MKLNTKIGFSLLGVALIGGGIALSTSLTSCSNKVDAYTLKFASTEHNGVTNANEVYTSFLAFITNVPADFAVNGVSGDFAVNGNNPFDLEITKQFNDRMHSRAFAYMHATSAYLMLAAVGGTFSFTEFHYEMTVTEKNDLFNVDMLVQFEGTITGGPSAGTDKYVTLYSHYSNVQLLSFHQTAGYGTPFDFEYIGQNDHACSTYADYNLDSSTFPFAKGGTYAMNTGSYVLATQISALFPNVIFSYVS
ncbi:MAG: hypothetical protein LBS95_02460 [Mycoplasmataceae bacterium]|jgi:hypothetical protein|nr:hypothetical protein [Mycoplasmataceae bacterium]